MLGLRTYDSSRNIQYICSMNLPFDKLTKNVFVNMCVNNNQSLLALTETKRTWYAKKTGYCVQFWTFWKAFFNADKFVRKEVIHLLAKENKKKKLVCFERLGSKQWGSAWFIDFIIPYNARLQETINHERLHDGIYLYLWLSARL